MAVPSVITDLNVVAASNSPAGADSVASNTGPDEYFRALSAIIKREQSQGTATASAATIDLGAITTGSYLHITGSTGPITSFGTVAAGVERTLVFDSTPTITHHATSMILLGGESRTMVAGDICVFRSEGSGNWREVSYNGATFIQTGTGAVARTPLLKMRDVVSVFDFMTTAQRADVIARTKTVDCRAAIQAAIDAVSTAGGGTVFCPAGTYLISSYSSGHHTVVPKSGVNVIGDGFGTIFTFANGMVTLTTGLLFLYDHTNALSNIRFSNFKIDWNGANNVSLNTSDSDTCRIGGGGGVTNWHMDNVWSLSPGGAHHVFIAGGGSKNSITNCVFQNAGGAVTGNTALTDHSSIYTDCDNTTVANNLFVMDNLNDTVSTGIEVHGDNVNVHGNTVYGYNIGIIGGASENTGSNAHYSIFGNIMLNTIDGIRIHAANADTNSFFSITDNEIYCRTRAATSGAGIRSVAASTAMSTNLEIHGNTVYLKDCVDLTLSNVGMVLQDWSELSVKDNTIAGWSGEGITYENTVAVVDSVIIEGNYLTDCGYTSSAANKRAMGINAGAGGAIAQTLVKNNDIIAGTGYAGTVATLGIEFNLGTFTHAEVVDNVILGQSGASIKKNAVEASNVFLVKHSGPENPFNLIHATYGSEYHATDSTRVWRFAIPADNGNNTGWRSVEYGTAAPASGVHDKGDICWNTSFTVGQPIGWACTVFGTPGTWVALANL